MGSPIGAGTSLWIGLTEPAEGRWVWSDGSIPKSGRWATGEPNNAGGNENCVEWYVSSGAWNDADCATPRGFVCEARTRGKASKFGCTGRLLTLAGVEYCVYPDSARDWGAAQQACQASGGTLAVIDTLEENQALFAAIGAQLPIERIWIGLHDRGREGDFRWTNGEPAGFRGFRPGEPNNVGDEDCIEWFPADGGWNDVPCASLRPSLCEPPP